MSQTSLTRKEVASESSVLGYFGFGMATILLNIHNLGLIPHDAMVIGMGWFCGGILQLLAGFFEWKKNNTFTMILFLMYSFFWFSLIAIFMLPEQNLAPQVDALSWTVYLLIWGIFSFSLFISSSQMKIQYRLLTGIVTLVFITSSLGHITDNMGIAYFSAYLGIICGIIAIYIAMVHLINSTRKNIY